MSNGDRARKALGAAGLAVSGVALHDIAQKKHAVLRNYPVVGHLRFLLEDIRPELQQYFIERNWDGRPYDRDIRSIVYERAKGIHGEQAFGTERDVNAMGYEYLVHSIVPTPAPHTPPRVLIGGPDCTQPYSMSLLNVSAMSFGALSANAIRALNKGAALGDVPLAAAPPAQFDAAVELLNRAEKVTLLVGRGARGARESVLDLARALQAPMVLTLKAKETLEHENPFQVGQSGLIGNSGAARAMDEADVLVMVGTDFPYRDWYPQGTPTIQLDASLAHIGRRTPVSHPLVGDVGRTLAALLPRLTPHTDATHLEKARSTYDAWRERQRALTDPGYATSSLIGRVRDIFDNPDDRIRPEVVAAAIDRHAAVDAILTSDTGMSTVWLSRFVQLGAHRRLVGSYNLGSMANAMPQALGAQALDRARQVISFSGDGGLMMLLGDLRTAVTFQLPIKVVVFDNGRLGMVKLEQEQGGLPEFGTVLDNPDIAAVAAALGLHARRVIDPDDVDDAVAWALSTPGPVLLDVLTNPDEISVPAKPTLAQGWGFAIAKTKEHLESPALKPRRR